MKKTICIALLLIILSGGFILTANIYAKDKMVKPQVIPEVKDNCCVMVKDMSIMLRDLAYIMQGTEIARSNIYVRQRCQEIMDKCGEITAMAGKQ